VAIQERPIELNRTMSCLLWGLLLLGLDYCGKKIDVYLDFSKYVAFYAKIMMYFSEKTC